jgi:hypothetical protein
MLTFQHLGAQLRVLTFQHSAIAAEAAGRQFDLRRGGQGRHLLRLFARPSRHIHQSRIDIFVMVDRGTHDRLPVSSMRGIKI